MRTKSTAALLMGSILFAWTPPAVGQAFDCVLLNDANTNIFIPPDECFFLPENALWCNCVRSLFTHPVRNEASGFNQAVQWIVDQPGIGNHRVEVDSGTLDLSSVAVDDVIGETLIHELIPESVGVPPGTFFTVRNEVRVTGTKGDSVDFAIVVVETSLAAGLVLEYDPQDECHSFGHTYSGRLTSRGPGNGFIVEYRYASENIQENPDCEDGTRQPGIDAGDTGSPGFTVRYLFRFFTTETGIYTLPDAESVDVTTTLRRFTEETLDEILEVGADDLCEVRDVPEADPDPCKIIDETLQVKTSLEENSPPTAEIVMIDPDAAFELFDPAEVQMLCDSARVIFRGGNSDDGDGGLQELSYEWFMIEGPPGGAVIPEETRTFKDTEITFTEVGEYEIGLRVDDGAAENSSDETSVVVDVRDDLNFNVTPTPVIVTDPDPAEVALDDGTATITLDGSGSANGFIGEDDCMQQLDFAWRQVDGPPGVEADIVSPDQAVTEVLFDRPGVYGFELEVDDGAETDGTATAEVEVTVTGDVQIIFRRGDSDATGNLTLTDGVFVLRFLFANGPTPPCMDAADSNDSGDLNLTDGIYVLRYLFAAGAPPPPSPGPDSCGPDPTADAAGQELDCALYEHCNG